jgi:hypothetical protein
VPFEQGKKPDPNLGRLVRHFLTGEDARTVLRLALRVIESAIPARLVTSV